MDYRYGGNVPSGPTNWLLGVGEELLKVGLGIGRNEV